MRKYLLLFLLIYFPFTYAQTADPEISLNFENKELPDILAEIEAKTDYQFFFDEDWFGLSKFSGDYSQTKVTEVLEAVLEETNINYYVKGQRVILTRGSIIYDRLQEGFLETKEETAVAEEENQSADPVFYNDNEEQSQ